MIYLDSAATSLLKPDTVARAMTWAMKNCASPGRGSHRPAQLAADTALDCRTELAGLFHMDDPEKVVFTLNATHGLNIAIRSLVRPGDPVAVSGYEHNAVTRPLFALGARVRVAHAPLFDPDATVAAFRRVLPGSVACVCCHVSNVFGYILPLGRIAALCREYGVPLVVDAAQSAGSVDIDFTALGAQYVAMPGHKGLMGPQGTGVLLCRDAAGAPLMSGGTGSNSADPGMPDYLPDRLEAGTHNITGLAGLMAGVRFVREKTPAGILEHEQALCRQLARALAGTPGLRVFAASPRAEKTQGGVLSVILRGVSCEEMAERLGNCGVAVRSGLHCAPTAHRTAGTLDTGTVRFSFSPFNTCGEIARAAEIFKKLL